MYNRIVDAIRIRTREEWRDLVLRSCEDVREWIHEHGELAAIFGLLLGVFIVVAFKFFLALVVVAAIAAFAIWQIALPASATPTSTKSVDSLDN